MMLRAIHNRTTSRSDDETLIIGTFLGIDVAPIVAASSEEKMATLFRAMKHIPANVLFTLGPRLSSKGLRWAPATFLRSKGGSTLYVVKDLVPMSLEQIAVKSWAPRPMSKLDAEGRGLWTFNPAIRLPELIRHNADSMKLSFEMFDTVFDFYGIDAEDFEDVARNTIQTGKVETMLNKGNELAILVQEFNPYERMYSGVLVEIIDDIIEPGYEGAKGVRYHMPVGVSNGNLRRSESLENIRGHGKVRNEGTNPETQSATDKNHDVPATWIEPRYWLVD